MHNFSICKIQVQKLSHAFQKIRLILKFQEYSYLGSCRIFSLVQFAETIVVIVATFIGINPGYTFALNGS